MTNINGQLERAAEAPFNPETAGGFGIEPVYDPTSPNFTPDDLERFQRISMLGRFGFYGGMQATFYVEAPGQNVEIDDPSIERGLELADEYKTVVDAIRPSYREKRIVGTALGSNDPREMVLLGGLSFFYDPGHDSFKYCLVYRRDSDIIRLGLRDDILEAHGPFDRGRSHTPLEHGIVQGVGSVVESLNIGVAKHLLWQDPEARPAANDDLSVLR